MKKLKQILLIVILIFLYTYFIAIDNIPQDLIVFEGENLNIKTLVGLTLNSNNLYETAQTSSNVGNNVTDQIGTTKVSVKLFDNINIKDINVNVIPKTKVIPLGSLAGVKLYTNGVLVVGMSEIEGTDNNKYKPYENTGIEEGDMIVSIDEKNINSTKELIQTVNESDGKNLQLKYVRNGKTQECSMTPVKANDNQYKLGLWVRDSAAGVGTVSFYEPTSQMFGALGHGITDIDTGDLINISKGEFITTKCLSITKGEKGVPGKIQGTIENQKNIGEIYKNTNYGIYGKVNNLTSLNLDYSKEIEVAYREEIKTGKAYILCSLDDSNPQQYEIEIEKIYTNNNYNNKSMEIRVTDEKLLEKTGGIIQGMSGSPIIQDGKFIGAITHVLVNNPKEGYAIFGDLMIKQMRAST